VMMDKEIELRHTFISMLFALVVTQCAVMGYDRFVSVPFDEIHVSLLMPILSHLILCIVILTTSWIGWSYTFVRKDKPKMLGVFCRAHFILILDLIILGLYFSLVKSIDDVGEPDVKSEYYLLSAIFVLYAIWDLAFSNKKIGVKERIKKSWITITFAVLLLAISIHVDLNEIRDWYYVVFVDLLLTIVVLLFRALVEPSNAQE
jgi:hypothetical protein